MLLPAVHQNDDQGGSLALEAGIEYTEQNIVDEAIKYAESFEANAEVAPQVETDIPIDATDISPLTVVDDTFPWTDPGPGGGVSAAELRENMLYQYLGCTTDDAGLKRCRMGRYACFAGCFDPEDAARLILNRTVDKPGAVFVLRRGHTLSVFTMLGALPGKTDELIMPSTGARC